MRAKKFVYIGILALLVVIVIAAGILVFEQSQTFLPIREYVKIFAFSITSAKDVQLETPPIEKTGKLGVSGPTEIPFSDSPLGILQPVKGLLPSDTVSVTLSLKTSSPANCRWSTSSTSLYSQMEHDFQQGQGTESHRTEVNDLKPLDNLRIYARCQSLSQAWDADEFQTETHLRILGSWENGYPRIANLWDTYDPVLGANFYAGYDLFIPNTWGGSANQAHAVREVNPSAKILITLNATYGWPELDPLTAEWWQSKKGEQGYECLLRNSHGEILLVEYWGHSVFNLTQNYCRQALVEQNVAIFLSSQQNQGADLAYDGIFWDNLFADISWLGKDVDSDLDGQPDDPAALDLAFRSGMQDFLAQIRTNLPNAILVGNEASLEYAEWINGRMIEWQLSSILNGNPTIVWDSVIADYHDWIELSQVPHITFIQTAPEALYATKFPFSFREPRSAAMQAEAAASYSRMRYGLTSTLMGDGLFAYDLRTLDPGDNWLWWYDEFGATGIDTNRQASSLPPRGYLGQPAGDPFRLGDKLNSQNQVVNGDFEDGMDKWGMWVDDRSGAEATFEVESSSGPSTSNVLHTVIHETRAPWSVLLYQKGKSTKAGDSYTLSFWARSDQPRPIYAKITKEIPPGSDYGFHVQAMVTTEWQHFTLWGNATETATDGELDLMLGEGEGEVWLDDIQFQSGARGVWARRFDNGLVVINATKELQVVDLPGSYRKLNGSQAPLYQIRVDDDEAIASRDWVQKAASVDQFGATVLVAPTGSRATVTYTPNLAYEGEYELLTWVAPDDALSSDVSITVYHALGSTEISLDETLGELGWHSLGKYLFEAGTNGKAVLVATGNNTVVADAFKWESTARYNDGSLVDQITLQPQDGIILLLPDYVP